MKDKKKLLLTIGLVLVLVLMIVGISYAAFKFTGTGKRENTITTGAITMKYTESTNTISMNNALPTTDATGKVRLTAGEYFDFTLSGTINGTENINWEIAAEDVTTGTKKIDGKYIKLYLTSLDENNNETEVMAPKVYKTESTENTYTGRPANMMSLAKGTTSTSFSTKYRLRMYVDESYNPQGDGGNLAFSIKINAYGKTGDKIPESSLANTLLTNGMGDNGTIDTSDLEQTFITGSDPNNYIWYSGKLWRAVAIDTSDNSVKAITNTSMAAIGYNPYISDKNFKDSYAEKWLNDTSVDGFLGNLREPSKFIKIDSEWNDTVKIRNTDKPEKTSIVKNPVGLLNYYEYSKTGGGSLSLDNPSYYLSTGVWYLLGQIAANSQYCDGNSNGISPVINFKPKLQVASGTGTKNDPYRLKGDIDSPLSGTLLSTRYSGEYISFGTGDNNLYRIVSHENGTGTKITSAIPLKEEGNYKSSTFGDTVNYSTSNTIGTFLNNDYLTSGEYLTSDQVNMIEDSTNWYIGTVKSENDAGEQGFYRLAKYIDATSNTLTTSVKAKVGLLRTGELLSSQFDDKSNNGTYWLLTPVNAEKIAMSYETGYYIYPDEPTSQSAIRPAMNLKSNVIITGGDGTKNSPFQIKLGS
mgnify:CR=1 FL=1